MFLVGLAGLLGGIPPSIPANPIGIGLGLEDRASMGGRDRVYIGGHGRPQKCIHEVVSSINTAKKHVWKAT